MVEDDFEFYEEEKGDKDVERAKPYIEDIVTQQKVVTDREVKVRLEDKFFPWVIGRALLSMESEGILRKVGYPGRRSKGMPESFYTLSGMEYHRIIGVIERKRQVSVGINSILTGYAPAGTHAEDLFAKAFQSLDFKIHARDASEFEGRRVQGIKGKEPPNLDFIVERNGIIYGVDVKNWIRYEYTTRKEVIFKVNLALQLRVVPFIIARYVDKDTIFLEVIQKGGICYPYKTLLVPPSFDSLAMEAGSLLGYPVLAVEWLPTYKVKWIEKLHLDFLGQKR
jgi:hypothetical protein